MPRKLFGAISKSRHTVTNRKRYVMLISASFCVLVVGALAWMVFRASTIGSELQSVANLVPTLKAQTAASDAEAVVRTADQIAEHTGKAREAADDPLFSAMTVLPWLGDNIRVTSELARSADDVAQHAALPFAGAFKSLAGNALQPPPSILQIDTLSTVAPEISKAAKTVRMSASRLETLKSDGLYPSLSEALSSARSELAALEGQLDIAADATRVAPSMMGADGPRRYLLLMQNNAESRASGGIPGAIAVVVFNEGRVTLESQTSATALGRFQPQVKIDPEQEAIYSSRVGRFMQDVNLTPDFPTTAATARTMWERKTGESVDGVISLDPVALSLILKATGPITMSPPAIEEIGKGLPEQLTANNVVRTLLSDVYSKIEEPALQDVYFAAAAEAVFTNLSSDRTDPTLLISALSSGISERRVLLWSGHSAEQDVISTYPLGGMISGPSVAPAQFGVYFNDGTGAKMDFWIKRTVRVVRDCARDGYRNVTIRVTSSNTAPADAATSLPSYVTGAGNYGVPAGSVQTNVVAYGPVQSTVDTVHRDGDQIPFSAHRHSQRGVGVSTARLAPGESTTLDFNFGHIVQNSKPELVVTPTTQPVKDVLLAPDLAPCE